MASSFVLFENTLKGSRYYFRVRYVGQYGVRSPWSNIVGKLAGDYDAPAIIGPDDVTVTVEKAAVTIKINSSWTAPADIKEIRWYKRARLATADPVDWAEASETDKYLILPVDSVFTVPGEYKVGYVYDVWAVPVDIANNTPAGESIVRCATGIHADAIAPVAAACYISDNGVHYVPFSQDSWHTASEPRLKIEILDDTKTGKSIYYSVKTAGSSEFEAWRRATPGFVVIDLAYETYPEGVTLVRYYTANDTYPDVTGEVIEIQVKWDSHAPAAPEKPATIGNSPGSVTWKWTDVVDSASGLDHYEVSYQAAATLAGDWSDPIIVSGRAFTRNTTNDYQYQLRVRAVDKAGNISAWSTVSDIYKEDTKAPTLIHYAKSGGSKVDPVASGWYNQNALTLYAEADDTYGGDFSNNSDVQAILYSIGGTVWRGEAGDSVEIALSEGIQDVYLRTLDNSGNGSTIVHTQIKWDKTAPTTPSFDASFCEGSDDRISLKWANGTDANSGLYETLIYRNEANDISSAYLAAKIPAGQTSYIDHGKTAAFDNVFPLIPGKTYYYWLKHTDLAGNTSAASAVQSVTMRENMASLFANYLDNSSFERGSSFPIGWTSGGATYVSTGGKHGNKFMRATSAATLLYDYVFATAGQQYTISAYVKAASGSPTCRIAVQWYDGSGTLLSSENIDFASVASSWARRSTQITAPTPVSGYLSHAKITISSTTTTAVDIDAVQWEEGATATIYQDTRSTSADRLSAHVIRGEHIVAGAITADKITVTTLSALSANLGNVTAGELHIGSGANSFHVNTAGDHWAGADAFASAVFSVSKAGALKATSGYFGSSANAVSIESGGLAIGPSGAIRWEKDDYSDTAAGIWIGYDSSAYKANIGDATHYMKFTGAAMDITGATVRSASSGARIEMFPDSSTGLVVYDNSGTPAEVFRVNIGGTDVGDVVIGNYSGGQGAKWDKSTGLFDVKGSIAANSVDVGTTGYLMGGKSSYADTAAGFWLGYTGGATSKHQLYIGDNTQWLKWSGTSLSATGLQIATPGTGARVIFYPSNTIGLVAYDSYENQVFQVVTAGDDAGDIVFGGYNAGNSGAKWDNSASGFLVRGTVYATAGTIGALTVNNILTVGTGSPTILIDGTNKRIETSNYVSGTTGWRIDSSGDAEFNNITSRGVIKTAVFQKSLVSAFAGSSMISKSASILVSDATLGSSFTIVVKPQAGAAPFTSGDMIYIKNETVAIYATVGSPSASGSNYQYTATRLSGSSSGTVPAGETVVDFGVANDGRIMLTADDGTNSPYMSIATHDKVSPTWTERVRIGNLAGISGLSGYGLWTNNGYFTGTVNATAGYFGSGSTVVAIESGGLSVGSGGVIRGEKNSYTDTDAGFWLGSDSGTYKFYIGDASKYLKWTGTTVDISGTFQTALTGQRLVLDSANSLKWYSATSSNPVIQITPDAYGGRAGISLSDASGVALYLTRNGSNYVILNEYGLGITTAAGGSPVNVHQTATSSYGAILANVDVASPESEVAFEGMAQNSRIFAVFGSGKVQAYGGFHTAASSYLSFGSTYGTSGYGIRDNAGTMEYKSSGGSWSAIGSGGGVSLPTVSRGALLYGNSTPAWATLAIGTSGKVLYSNGTDVSWATSPAVGSNTQVQYNDSGSLGGSSTFVFDKTTGIVTATKFVSTDDLQTGDKLIFVRTGGNVTIDASSPDIAVTVTIPSLTANSEFLLTTSSQTITGSKTFSTTPVLSAGIRTAASTYFSFGATYGSTGYGLRDNAGAMEYKNSGGAWTAMGSGGGAPGGANTYVQYNGGGSFAGESVFTYNATTDTLSVPVVSIGRAISVKAEDTNVTFDLSTTNGNQDNILLENTVDDVQQWGYGGSIGFARINGLDRKAAIFAYQTGSDGDQLGLGFAVHPSSTGGDAMVIGATLDHAGIFRLPYSGIIAAKELTYAPSAISLPTGSSNMSQIYAGYDAGADSYTKLLIHADGTSGSTSFTDVSGTSKSLAGTATNSTSVKKFGTASAYFNGSAYIYAGDSSDWAFGNGDFTIDAWVYFNSLPGSGSSAGFVSQYADSSNYNWFYLYNNSSSSTYDLRYQVKSGGSDTILVAGSIPSGLLSTGAWHHYAVVRKSNDFNFYFDGLCIGTGYDTSSVPDIYANLFIGAMNTGSSMLNGYMDAIRVSNGVARWSGDFLPPVVSLFVSDQAGNRYVAKATVPEKIITGFPHIQRHTPTSGTEAGRIGRLTFDDDYLYIWLGNAVVGQVAISSFGS